MSNLTKMDLNNISKDNKDATKLDVSMYPVVHVNLDGYQNKLVLFYNGKLHLLKFSREKNGALDKTHVAEYISSQLANKLGIPCQSVKLVEYNGIDCCMCEYITEHATRIHCYKDINDSSVSSDFNLKNKGYTFAEVIEVLASYKNSHDNFDETLSRFLLMTAFDALIGNADRHWGNWGYIGREKDYVGLAPLYDNGNSMCTILTEKKMKQALSLTDNEFKNKYVIGLPNSQLKLGKSKLTFAEVVDLYDLKQQFKEMKSTLTTQDIADIMEDSTLKLFCTDACIAFIKKFLIARYRYFIEGDI